MKKTLVILVALLLLSTTSFSQSQNNTGQITVKRPVGFVKTVPLSSMEIVAPSNADQAWEITKRMIPNPSLKDKHPELFQYQGIDAVLQNVMGNKIKASTTSANFDGLDNISGVAPPDNMGDVGIGNYFQMINLNFAVFSKTGTLLLGPANNNTLWSNLPGPWSNSNDGDPIVNYDEMADRWVVSQFALPNFPNGSFYEMVAISATSDPLGSWYLYAYEFTDMPDYPKFGVWPDAYYLSVNSFSAGALSFKGAGVAALQRDSMLVGNPNAQMVFYQQTGGVFGLIPADLDGTNIPPSGTPGIFGEVGSSNTFNIYNFLVDWNNPTSSIFAGPTPLTVNSFNSFSGTVPQKGTSDELDALADRLMYRLQYRYFGPNDERMVTNHTVDNGSGVAAPRWYEFRNSGGGWSTYQQGTYSPDGNNRWMGSIAMDVNGNIALGYSVSSDSVYPGIRYTGRFVNDPLGQMTIQETSIYDGTASQTTVNRWGDYTNMTVDPTDGSTFWYTNEYSNGGWNWATKIAGFSFEVDNTPPSAITDIAVTGTLSNTADLQWTATGDDGNTGSASSYDIRYSTSLIDASNWDTATPVSNSIIPKEAGQTETFTVTDLDFATTYFFAIEAIDNLGNSSGVSNSPSGTTDNPPVISVTPTSLAAALFTGATEDTSFTIANAVTAGSTLEYLLEMQFPTTNKSIPKPLSEKQKQKIAGDINRIGNGPHPKLHAIKKIEDRTLLLEDFENGIPPTGWTNVDNAGTGMVWLANTDAIYGEENYTGGTGVAATVSSDKNNGTLFDAELWTPSISVVGSKDIYLTYKANFQDLSSADFLDLDISYDGGTAWTTIQSWNEDHGVLHGVGENVSILLDTYLQPTTSSIILRWHYYTTDTSPWQWYAEIDDVEIVGGSAWLTINPVAGSVEIGGEDTTQVAFNAAGLVGGTYNANIVVSSNDPVNPSVPVAAQLVVTGVQNITVTPDTINYNTLFVNDVDSSVVTVSNTGTDDLTVSSIAVDNADYTLSDANLLLTSGASKDVMVYFSPSASGPDNGILTITSDDPDEPTITVTLLGAGSDSPVINVDPLALSADLLTGQTKDTSFTVSNVSPTTSLLQYTVSIQYPNATQPVHKKLTKEQIIKSNRDVNKVGKGPHPKLYAITKTDSSSLLQEDFENGIPPTGWTNVDNAGTGMVWLANTDGLYGEGNYTNGTGVAATVSSDANNGTLFDAELWTPSIPVVGRKDLYLTYKANFQDLSGADFLDVDFSDDGGTTWTTIQSWNEDHGVLHGDGESVSILLDTYLPSGTNSIILRWHYYTTATSPWQWYAEIDDVEIYGGSAWLTVDPLAGALNNGESQLHSVQFNAAGLFGGTYNADIVVNNDDPLNPNPAVTAALTVTGVQDISVNPDSVDYGTIFVSAVDSAVINVANAGTDDLTVSNISFNNTVFSTNSSNFVLSPGSSQDVVVYYSPLTAQVDNGTMTITSDDPDEPTFDVVLTGTAVNPPIIGVTPSSLSADLITGDTQSSTFTISNTGESALDYTIAVEQTGAPLKARISKIHLPKSNGKFKRGTAKTSFMKAPVVLQKHNTPNGVTTNSMGYSANLSALMYQNFDVTTPGTLNDIIATGSLFAGAVSHSEPNIAYGIDFDNKHLVQIDIPNAFVTDLGIVTGANSEDVTGMAFTNDYCYIATYTGAVSNLYTLDVTTAVATFVGQISDGLVISIAADNEGNLFAEDIATDILVSVDPVTGAGTEIGSIGFDANYAQGMGFDHESEVLYMAAYNNDSGTGELRVVDTQTGNTLQVGPFDAASELDMLSFLGKAGGNWLVVNPLDGTVPAAGSVDISVLFDANGLTGGDYTANINVTSNDPVTPTATVTAALHVTGAPNIEVEPVAVDFGDIFAGYSTDKSILVSNTGTDDLVISSASIDNAAFSTNAAPVTLTSGQSVEWTITAAPTSSGSLTGTLTINSNSGSNPALDVPISANVVNPPIIQVSPTDITVAMNEGETGGDILTINNTGGSDLNYSIAMEILTSSNAQIDITLPASGSSLSDNAKKKINQSINERHITVNQGVKSPNGAVSLLILSPDTDNEISDLVAAMNGFTDIAVTQFPSADLAALTLADLTPYQVVLVQNDLTWESASGDPVLVGNVLADYVDAGGKVISNMYMYSFDQWQLGGRFITDGYGPFDYSTTDMFGAFVLGTVLEPNHPIMDGVSALDDTWGHQDPVLATNALLIANWDDGQPLVAVNDNVVGFNMLPINGNGAWLFDMATLLHNSVLWLGGTSWLAVTPAEGTVAAGSSVDVTVAMDGSELAPGDYFATLHVASNDPNTAITDVPVTLGILSGVIDDLSIIPTKYELSQNYPNPFNPSTMIRYALPFESKVTLKIFDVLGREITTLVNQTKKAGIHSLEFNASKLASGVYFFAIHAEGIDGTNFVNAKKFILMK